MTHAVIEGIMFGLALGDALGWPGEFVTSWRALDEAFGPNGLQEPPDPAVYTDDTQMTIALCEAVLDAGMSADDDALMAAVGRRFLEWSVSPENNRAPGNTVMAGLRRYADGVPWRESGLASSKGCGAAMRVAPLGYLYQHDPARLKYVAAMQAVITHRHETAVASAVAAAFAVKLALDGVHPMAMVNPLLEVTAEYGDEMTDRLLRIGHVLGWTNQRAAIDHLGQGWVGDEAVALALLCAIQYPDDYVGVVRMAAHMPGDCDTVACIAGGIVAARVGLAGVPADWRARCENAAYLSGLSARLALARAG